MGAVKRGSALMEFVLVMPILFMLIMGVIQFAQIMVVRQFVAYAAFCATRSIYCSNPKEWSGSQNSKNNCAFQAARRVLAWVTIFGTPETANLRSWDEEHLSIGAGDFAEIEDDNVSFATTVYGSKATHDVLVPGWGQVPESNSVDRRLKVEADPESGKGKYAAATVRYKFPLLIPVAGQMISFFAKNSVFDSQYMKNKDLTVGGWTGEEELFDGVPYIELKETCVLPLPYSTANLPENAFDYTTYD